MFNTYMYSLCVKVYVIQDKVVAAAGVAAAFVIDEISLVGFYLFFFLLKKANKQNVLFFCNSIWNEKSPFILMKFKKTTKEHIGLLKRQVVK